MKNRGRAITVGDQTFRWVLRRNALDGGDQHITVFRIRAGTPLKTDPYPWDFEVGPKLIAEAIRFALDSGWDPQAAGLPNEPGPFRSPLASGVSVVRSSGGPFH